MWTELKAIGDSFPVYRKLVRKFGLVPGIFLSKIAWWQNSPDNWVQASRKKLECETTLSEKTLQRAQAVLVRAGVLKVRYERLQHLQFYQVNVAKLDSLVYSETSAPTSPADSSRQVNLTCRKNKTNKENNKQGNGTVADANGAPRFGCELNIRPSKPEQLVDWFCKLSIKEGWHLRSENLVKGATKNGWHKNTRANWVKCARKLLREKKSKQVKATWDWWSSHWRDDFVPKPKSFLKFYEKFDAIVDQHQIWKERNGVVEQSKVKIISSKRNKDGSITEVIET